MVIVEVCDPSIRLSSLPVTVTVWGVSQLLLVKVTVVGEIDVSSELPSEIEKVTSVVGWTSNTMVKVSLVPDSSTEVVPEDSEIVKASPSAKTAFWVKSTGITAKNPNTNTFFQYFGHPEFTSSVEATCDLRRSVFTKLKRFIQSSHPCKEMN